MYLFNINYTAANEISKLFASRVSTIVVYNEDLSKLYTSLYTYVCNVFD